jgi:dienelactone hydrolase
MTTTAPVPVLSSSATTSDPPAPAGAVARRWTVLEAVIAVHGVSLAAMLSADDPFPWPQIRAAAAVAVTAGGWWAVRRGAQRLRGGVLLGIGLMGLVIGGAIGVPHAVRTGVTVESGAGVAALATGILLTGAAIRVLTRGAWWRKVLAVPLGIGIAIGVVFPLTLATFVTNVPPLEAKDGTPADRGMAYEDVSLRTDDGVRLAAWYVPSTNGAAVVLLAGAGGVRSDEIDHAAVLARHGYGVLLVDVRGHGDSDGDAMLWGWHGAADVRAAVDHLAARPELAGGRIAAMGMSMGAEEAINAIGADARVHAVVAEGASGQGPADEGTDQSGIGGWVARYIDWTTTRAADLMTSAHRPPRLQDSIAQAAPRPVMIIAGGEEPVEIDAGHQFQATAPDSVELWIVPGAGHTKGLETVPVEWEQQVIGFLDRALV